MAVVFLINLLCAIVPCDPYYTPPQPFHQENTIVHGFRRGNELYSTLHSSNSEPPLPFVETKGGKLEGYFMKVENGRQIYAFEGVPYAETPKRFKAPIPKRPWRGVRQAKKPGHLCVQVHPMKQLRVVGHEDCLTVNIYSPMISLDDYESKLPVVIFFHGGSFFFGAGSEYGPAYLLDNDVILVTVNYRLGVLGFLSTGDEVNPGNWGLKDQALAIQWVSDNIAAFGGDPNSITLMGQSAGAVAVHLHMMSNMTKHLFHKAISMSGSGLVGWAVHTPHQARKWAEKLARFTRCPTNRGTEAMMNCFRTRDPNFLTSNMFNLFDIVGALPPVLLRPVIEPDIPDAFLTVSPEEAYEKNQVSAIPYLATNTRDEAEFFRVFLTGSGFFGLWRRNWKVLGPTMLDIRRISTNSSAVISAIAEQYFGKNFDVAKLPGREITRIATDRYFNIGNRKTLKLHSALAPTYSYIFSFHNPKGFAHLFGMDYKEFGVSHTEDLAFVVNSSVYWEAFDKTDGSIQISNLVVNLFTNFIMKGEPLYTENGKDRRIWEPVKNPDNPMFLQIDQEVKMIPDPAKENIKFWERIGLNEFYPYEYV